MSQEQWSIVDDYITGTLLHADQALDRAMETSAAAGLPSIAVAPNQGKLLALLAESLGAHRILEVGTLGGYSAIWLARVLPPGGLLVTLEVDPKHARVARDNLVYAGLSDRVDLREGPATLTLQAMIAEGTTPFDFVFIDADKASLPDYYALTVELTRPGGLIVVDNVVRKGAVANASSTDPNVLGVRRMNELIARDARVSATAVQTVGSKGYDGFALIRVNPDGV